MLRARVLVQARLADVVPADHLHCLCLDEVAAQAADMQMELVEHVVVEGCILGELLLHGLFLGLTRKPVLFHLLTQLGQLHVARLQFVEILVLLDLQSIIKLVDLALHLCYHFVQVLELTLVFSLQLIGLIRDHASLATDVVKIPLCLLLLLAPIVAIFLSFLQFALLRCKPSLVHDFHLRFGFLKLLDLFSQSLNLAFALAIREIGRFLGFLELFCHVNVLCSVSLHLFSQTLVGLLKLADFLALGVEL